MDHFFLHMHTCFSSSTTWVPPRELFLNVVNIVENISKDDTELQQSKVFEWNRAHNSGMNSMIQQKKRISYFWKAKQHFMPLPRMICSQLDEAGKML